VGENKLSIAAYWNEVFRKESPYSELHEPSDIIKAIVRIKQAGAVLDLGVGNSEDTLYLATKGFDVAGVDISEVGISLFKESAKSLGVEVKGIVGDMARFKFDRKYDVILSLASLNLITRDEASDLIQRVMDNTEDYGLNVITVFTELDPLEGAFFLFEHDELRNLYSEWEIISYNEYTTPIHEHENWPPHRHTNAELLAQKV